MLLIIPMWLISANRDHPRQPQARLPWSGLVWSGLVRNSRSVHNHVLFSSVILSKGRTDGWRDPQSPPQPNSHINVILGQVVVGNSWSERLMSTNPSRDRDYRDINCQ